MNEIKNMLEGINASQATVTKNIERTRQEALHSAEASLKKRIRKAKKLIIREVQAKREEEKGIQASYHNELQRASEQRSDQESAAVYSSLQSSYSEITQRSGIAEVRQLDSETYSIASNLAKRLSNLDETAAKSTLETLRTVGTDEKLIELAQKLSEGQFPQSEIYSFIALSHENDSGKEAYKCRLIIPAKLEDSAPILAENLGSKLEDILDTEDINGVPKDSVANDAKTGFIVYTITPKQPTGDRSALCARIKHGLTERVETLLPEGFKEMGLSHKVIEVDPSVIDKLIAYTAEQFAKITQPSADDTQTSYAQRLTIKDAIKLAADKYRFAKYHSEKGIRVAAATGAFVMPDSNHVDATSFVKYVESRLGKKALAKANGATQTQDSAQNSGRVEVYKVTYKSIESKQGNASDEIKRRAYAGLETLGDEINARKELASIFASNPHAATQIAKNYLDVTRTVLGKKGGVYVTKDSVREFLDTHTPTEKGWTKDDNAKKREAYM